MSLIIKEAVPEDAERLLKYMSIILEEPDSFLEMSEGEFILTEEEEAKFLEDCSAAENSIFLIAENEGEIIGTLLCLGSGRKKIKHNTVLGMTVRPDFRNRGIGSRLMEHAVKWGKENKTVKRIELHVFKTNDRAIHLYRKYGFVIEGEKQKTICVNDNYINEYIMALHL